MTERIVTLRNAAGHALHCILHEPAPGVPRATLGCLLLSPGVKMRVAPHRLYRKLLGEFLDRGIAVPRVDFHGLGDSEGDLAEAQLDQLYRQVQLGRHVDDVRTALRFLEREFRLERFVVGGLCGGALTGLLTSEYERGIVGLYAIGIPVVLDGGGAHVSANMTKGELSTWRGAALAKMLKPKAWLRVLTLRSDIRTILRSFFPRLGRGGRKVELARVPPPASPVAENLNPHFPRALFGLLQKRAPALLLFSGADRLQFEYQEKFATPWSGPLHEFDSLLQVTVIPKANHVLGDAAWVAEARTITAAWLDRCFK